MSALSQTADGSGSELAALVPLGTRRVLDLGCGAGYTARLIKKRFPGSWVTGVEPDPRAAAEARRHCDEVIASAITSRLLYPDHSFDCIVLAGSLGYVAEPVELLRGLARHLAPEGEIVASVPTARNLRTLQALASGIASAPRLGLITRRQIVAWLAEAEWDLTSLRPLRDLRVPWVPLPLAGARVDLAEGQLVLRGVSAVDLEELTARAFLLTARPKPQSVPLCSILVPVRRQRAASTCLAALRSQPPPLSHEIVVVEGAADEGLSTAHNRGARRARGEYLVFLDAATRPQPGWLDHLLGAIRGRAAVGAVGSRVLGPQHEVRHAGMAFGPRDLPGHNLPFEPYQGVQAVDSRVGRLRYVPAVAATGMLLSRRDFVDVGGFDEFFQGSLEDADLCLRLRSRGLTIVYCPGSVLDQDNPADSRQSEANTRYFLLKWFGRLAAEGDETDRTAQAVAGRDDTGAHRSPEKPAPVLWSSLLFDRSGYADEARNFVLALHRAGVAVQANPLHWTGLPVDLPPHMGQQLNELASTKAPARFIHVIHFGPAAVLYGTGSPSGVWTQLYFQRHPRAIRNIARTMLETDWLPPYWDRWCNAMDEVWVPSRFNVETFASAGVDRQKLHQIPGALTVDLYDPTLPPLPIPGAAGFVFLSVFGWGRRKGWDVLVQAYLEEFQRTEPVTLALYVTPSFGLTVPQHQEELERFIRTQLRCDPADGPRILMLNMHLGVHVMPRLYRAAHAFVMPSRGEGWGRPYMEAMAMGLPTIGTRWSGNLEFMTDKNAYLVDCIPVDVPEAGWTETPLYRGHRWAEPRWSTCAASCAASSSTGPKQPLAEPWPESRSCRNTTGNVLPP